MATSGPLACCCLYFEGGFSIHCHSADEEEVPVPSKPHMAQGQNNRRLTALRAERHTLTFAERSSCSACHELLCSRAFLFIVLRSAQHPQIPRFLQIFRGIWPMPLSLLNYSALLCLRNARAFPLLPAALASVLFGFVLVRVRRHSRSTKLGWATPSKGVVVVLFNDVL